VSDAEEVKANWQRIKQQERAGDDQQSRSLLSGVSQSMPALAGSQAMQERAAQVGFDWPEISGVLEKLSEELEELQSAGSADAREEEFGDLLFVLVNVARWLKLDAEDALRRANQKFRSRFGIVETLARQRGVDLPSAGLNALNALWDEAKAREKRQTA
jgi:tetrapyrrole methylase family protein / MazG family protein